MIKNFIFYQLLFVTISGYSQNNSLQNLALNQEVIVSSTHQNYVGANAVDGIVSDESRWLSSRGSDSAVIQINLESEQRLGGIHIYSGFGAVSAVRDFKFQFFSEGTWKYLSSIEVSDNRSQALRLPFDENVSVVTKFCSFSFHRFRRWLFTNP